MIRNALISTLFLPIGLLIKLAFSGNEAPENAYELLNQFELIIMFSWAGGIILSIAIMERGFNMIDLLEKEEETKSSKK